MSGPMKVGLALIFGVIAVVVALNVVGVILGLVLKLVIPVAILAGIGFIIYGLVSRNALPGGRRYLP
jgi:hypothetical protein